MLIRVLLQLPFNNRLSHSIPYRWPQKSLTPILFGDFCLSYCLGKIAAVCKPVPYRVKVFPWFARYGIDGYSINTGAFSICSYFFESFPDLPSLDLRARNKKEKCRLRQTITEHPFGVVKRQWGYDHLMMKGLQKTDSEISLIFLCYNLKRVMNILGINGILAAIKAFSQCFGPFLNCFSAFFKVNTSCSGQLNPLSLKKVFLT
jgi:hypothetical protein